MRLWRRVAGRRTYEARLEAELNDHLQRHVADLVRSGLGEVEARRQARLAFGGLDQIAEDCRDVRPGRWVEVVARDVRYALRQLRRSPVFATVAVVSLALGIGANTAIFSLVDQSLLRTLHVKDPHELVFLYHPGPVEGGSSSEDGDGPSFNPPIFRGLQQSQTPFTGLAGARSLSLAVTCEGKTQKRTVHRVSGNYFEVLGGRAALGRLLTEDDDRIPGGHPVVVLSHQYWMRRFGGEPSVLGRTLVVKNCPMTIVGVAAEGFRGQQRRGAVDLFVPISMNDELEGWKGSEMSRFHWIELVARLKPGVSRERATAEINLAYRAELEKDLAASTLSEEQKVPYRAKRIVLKTGAYGRGGLAENGRRQLGLVQAIAMLALLIACANVAGAQLGRAVVRTRDTSIRLALGASRTALVRQHLVESGVLATFGGVLGALIAAGAFPLLKANLPSAPIGGAAALVGLDARVLAFAAGLSALTALVFGLYPALQASRSDLGTALKDQSGQASAAPAVGRLRRALAAGQIALSLCLLVCAGLFARTLFKLARTDVGIRVDGLMTFSPNVDLEQYSSAPLGVFNAQLKERLSAVPGVRSVSIARVPVLASVSYSNTIVVEGHAPGAERLSAQFNTVDSPFFRTLGMPIVSGRDFRPDDEREARKVSIVNEAFVRRFFGERSPLGRRLSIANVDTEIIGVVRDSKYSELRAAAPPLFYQLGPPRELNRFYVRTDLGLAQLRAALQNIAAGIQPTFGIGTLKTMREQVDENMSEERNLSMLTAAFAAAAALLAGLGLYGVLAHNVARRTREFGIRIAMGAGGREIRRLLVREVWLLLAIGSVFGVAGAVGIGGAVQALLYEVSLWDPIVYLSALGILGLMAIGAAYGPARRAMCVDPILALRHD